MDEDEDETQPTTGDDDDSDDSDDSDTTQGDEGYMWRYQPLIGMSISLVVAFGL